MTRFAGFAVSRPTGRTAGRVAAGTIIAAALLALGGCAHFRKPAAPEPVAAVKRAPRNVDAQPQVAVDGTPIERVEFRVGVSSATVEKLARETAQCTSRQGAGLVSEPGPVEIYRVACENGQTFMARCELRQCARYGR